MAQNGAHSAARASEDWRCDEPRHGVPSPACGGGRGKAQAPRFGSTPSPSLPRERGREEFAARALPHERSNAWQGNYASSTTVLRSTPISGTPTSTTSAGVSHLGGL